MPFDAAAGVSDAAEQLDLILVSTGFYSIPLLWSCLLITIQMMNMLRDFGEEEMFQRDAADWAQQTFGDCELGDKRRTKRLVDIGMRMASQVGSSLSKCCEGDEAALVGIAVDTPIMYIHIKRTLSEFSLVSS